MQVTGQLHELLHRPQSAGSDPADPLEPPNIQGALQEAFVSSWRMIKTPDHNGTMGPPKSELSKRRSR